MEALAFRRGSFTFAGTSGESDTITVIVNGDAIVEADETFTASLGVASNPSVTASDGTGQGTIQNDDSSTFAIDDVSQVEGAAAPPALSSR